MRANVDWKLARLQYELFGVSFDEIAEDFGTPVKMVEYVAEEKGWERKPLAQSCQDWETLDCSQVGDELITEIQDRLKTLTTIKQTALNPSYIAIETALLGKALRMIEDLRTDDPNGAIKLKQIAEVYTSLREQNQPAARGADGDEGSAGVVVNILGQISASDDGHGLPAIRIDAKSDGVQRSLSVDHHKGGNGAGTTVPALTHSEGV